MFANTVLVLSALVGNTIYVNYVPKTHSAEICINKNNADIKHKYCKIMEITNINGTTMWYKRIDDDYLMSSSYFMINYMYPNKTTINSKWNILTQKNMFEYSSILYLTISCFAFIFVMYLSIAYFLWKINTFLN